MSDGTRINIFPSRMAQVGGTSHPFLSRGIFDIFYLVLHRIPPRKCPPPPPPLPSTLSLCKRILGVAAGISISTHHTQMVRLQRCVHGWMLTNPHHDDRL
jgi:hypothetical protein